MDVGLPIKTTKDPPCTRTARKESYRLLEGKGRVLGDPRMRRVLQDPRIRKFHESKRDTSLEL